MLVQLCCGATTSPEELQKLYDQSEGKKQQPTIPSLADAFVSILRNRQKNYIIVDALDECSSKYSPAREGMLSLIKRLTDDSSISINTLILSRREQDIEKELRPIITEQVCIQNKTVDADIRVHVRRLLVEDPRLKNRSPSVKEEIESSIVNGARGMWVMISKFVYGLRHNQWLPPDIESTLLLTCLFWAAFYHRFNLSNPRLVLKTIMLR